MESLAEAVQHGHERGILHRDLKPANVMLVPKSDAAGCTDEERLPFIPRLTDFGMAKLVDANLTPTRSSVVIGTPLYMAPEKADSPAREVGPASDVYGLGAILYELLTGSPPYDDDSVLRVLERLRSDDEPAPPREARPAIPAELETICLKCLRQDPARRYESAAALAADLQRFLLGEPVRARRLSWLARFWNWSRRPQRIREAAILTIWLNAIVAGWVALNVVLSHEISEDESSWGTNAPLAKPLRSRQPPSVWDSSN